jgi:hypothetical protein
MASYTDGDQKGNPYIFNPAAMQRAMVTGRTLEIASNIVNRRDKFDEAALQSALQGAVGTSAAFSIMSFIRHNDSLTPWEVVIANPETARLPEDPAAIAVMCYGALERIDRSNATAWFTYLGRFETEWQVLFNLAMARSPTKQQVGFTCKSFTEL